MNLEDWQLKLMKVEGNHTPQPFCHLYEFVKNNQRMTGADFRDTLNEITDILEQEDVNYGILILATGFLVFTEVPLKLDAVMVKLATGINFEGEAGNAGSMLSRVNTYLGRDRTE